MWVLLSVFSMLTSGIRRVYDKNLTGHFGNISLPFVMNIFTLVPISLLLFFFPIPKDVMHLPWDFWWPVFASCLIQYPVQIYFYIRAIREGEISSVMPLMTLAPVFNIATSFFLVGELPSTLGFIGIAVTVLGVYFLLKKKGTHLKPLPELYMIISMFMLALGASFDKVAIRVSTPMWYAFVGVFITTIVMGIYTYASRQHVHLERIRGQFKNLAVVGILFAVSYVSLEFAYVVGPTSYVLAIRSGVYILTALYGIFKLKESISPRKIVALVLFIAGSIILAFA